MSDPGPGGPEAGAEEGPPGDRKHPDTEGDPPLEDPDLRAVVESWPDLSPAVRKALASMAEASAGRGKAKPGKRGRGRRGAP